MMQSQSRVLVVEDDATHGFLMSERLRQLGLSVDHVTSCGAALARLREAPVEVVVLDVGLPDGSGLELHATLREDAARGPSIVYVTADDRAEPAVRALRGGAVHYIVKRPDYLDAMAEAVAEAVAARPPEPASAGEAGCGGELGGFAGASPAARRVRSLTACYGRRDHPVLVTGETGTGKELVARGLHEHSPRAARPFVAVNCAAVSPALFESEVFGSVRGAFTGASGSRRGLVGAARGGTLFLDEIGELPLEMQAKLLRLLEAGRYRRVGAETEEAAEVRIVAATNRPLEDAVGEGSFRRDLYYRLHVLRIHVPPLRERRADVPALVRRFLAELGEAQAAREIAPGALAALMAHDWPGNVRELRHVVERTIVAQGDACGRILGFEIAPAGTAPLPEAPRALAPAQLVALLTQHRGRLGRVAAEAGVSVRTVQRRMKDLDLRLMDFRRAGESIARGAA